MKPHPPVSAPASAVRPRRWPSIVALAGAVLAIVIGIFAMALHAMEPPAVPEGTHGAGVTGTRAGITVALLTGDAAACGEQAGHLLKDRLLAILKLTRLRRSFNLSDAERGALVAGLAPHHRTELEAVAQAAGAQTDAVYDANLALDTLCNVLLTGADGRGPVRMARNMDFFPAHVLGPGTVVTVWRVPGLRSVAAIGWPGYAGVISGMNDAGLTAAVLQNGRWHGTTGTPLAFRVREVLETAGTVEDAITAFRRAPVTSDHFVVLADAKRAAVVWYDGAFHRRDPVNGVLTCSNGAPDAQGDQDDDRTRALRALVKDGAIADDTQLKQALTRVYLREINAQAMLFRPDQREVDLAVSSLMTPAAKQSYRRMALGPWLDGRTLGDATVTEVGAVPALSHH